MRFDLNSNTEHSPEMSRKKERESRYSDTETGDDRKHRSRRRRHRGEGERHRDSPQLMNDKYERAPSGTEEDSDTTVDLPERFDEHGNRKSHDPLAEALQNILGQFTQSRDSEDDGRNGRHRSRR